MNCERCGQPLTPDQVCCHACDTPVALPVPDLPIPRETMKAAADFVGRTWVLDEVEVWQAHGSEGMLLVTGEPGSGKTALAAWLAGGGPPPGVLVRGAVKAVAPDAVFPAPLRRDAVAGGVLRHAGVTLGFESRPPVAIARSANGFGNGREFFEAFCLTFGTSESGAAVVI